MVLPLRFDVVIHTPSTDVVLPRGYFTNVVISPHLVLLQWSVGVFLGQNIGVTAVNASASKFVLHPALVVNKAIGFQLSFACQKRHFFITVVIGLPSRKGILLQLSSARLSKKSILLQLSFAW